MLEVGVKYAASYEPGHGIGISTFLYRRMRIRVTDWYRSTLGDSRVAIHEKVPPGGFCFRFDDLHDVGVNDPGYDSVGTLADDLDPSSAWTLTHLAEPIASGWPLTKAAAAAGVSCHHAGFSLVCRENGPGCVRAGRAVNVRE